MRLLFTAHVTALCFLSYSDAWICAPQLHNGISRSIGIQTPRFLLRSSNQPNDESDEEGTTESASYSLGIGKNLPIGSSSGSSSVSSEKITPAKYNLGADVNPPMNSGDDQSKEFPEELHWHAPHPVIKPEAIAFNSTVETANTNDGVKYSLGAIQTRKKMVARNDEGQILRGALWDESHFDENESNDYPSSMGKDEEESRGIQKPEFFYPDIDLSIPESVFSEENDVVWDLMRWEAYLEAEREPLLVSYLHSTILNHPTLESSLAFMLANRLSSAAMISTQVQSLIMDAFRLDSSISRSIRADLMACRDRDPACTGLPDVFLYFKGFHALQTYRVAHALYRSGRRQTGAYLQSQMTQNFQIDIHPNSSLGRGIMLDHGTGIVIGETAQVGHNCSILHHVTLGGSGKRGIDRHPKVGNGVLLGAGASILGSVTLGDGCQVGAGTLVITDLPPHSVAVGVPAKIIGSFVDVTEQPSIGMDQTMDDKKIITFQSDGI